MPHTSHPSYPMTGEQESIWLNDQFQDGTSRYLESWTYRLRGAPVEPAAVQAALDGIVARHEALRSRLHLDGAQPRQTVLPPAPVELEIRRVTPAQLPAALTEAATRPVALHRPPLLRATLLQLDTRTGGSDAVLVVAVHHAVVDGWCWSVLDTEFSALYRAALDGSDPQLPELPVQFGPYAQTRPAPSRASLEYWRRTLAGAPEQSTFPTDRPRPAVLGTGGDRVEFTLEPGLVTGVRALARRARTTPFTVLATALGALLARTSGRQDVVIGTPVSRRDDERLEPMLACLTDVMPLRQHLDPTASFAELTARTKAAVWAAVRHRDVPHSHLVRDLKTARSTGRFPLFQVVFGLDDAPAPALDLPGITAERLYVHGGTAKYDVFLHMVPEADGLHGYWEFSTDLFDRATAQRLTARLTTLLASAVAHPDRPLAELDVLPPEEHALLRQWTHGPPPAADRPLAHEAVAAQARRTPHAPALVHRDRTLTYAQLDAAATNVAAHLVARGAARQPVGICLRRSPHLAVAVLGVLKAGGCCLPLDPDYPADRLAFMAADSRITTVLTQRDLAHLVDAEPVVVDDLPPAPAVALPAADPDDLGYLIYTSGSTGRPKGVAMPHRSLANLLAWQRTRSAAATGTRTLQFAPLGFDVAFQELFSTWATGGTLVMTDDGTRRDPARLLGLLAAERVERLFLPFVALQQLAEYACATGRTLPRLREVATAGEQLFATPALREFFRSHAPDAVLDNQYGPSETHVVTAERLAEDPASWPDLPPIGRPVAGTRISVLDEALRPVPPGTPGELCVAGPALADGYLGHPGLTAEKFVLRDGVRLYRTGDLVRHLPDGRLQYLGRRDDQVKIRGHRVETGEIEAVLRALPAVADAAVVAQETPAGRRLVAHYLTATDDAANPPRPAAVRQALAERLPDHMVPAAVLQLERFPLTPSGKLDRAALPRPEHPDTRPPTPCDPPTTATERRIARIWSDLLDIPRIGVRDDFFALGGHSLLATRLVLRIQEELGTRIPPGAVSASATVARLAALVDGNTTAPALDLPAETDLPADIVPAPDPAPAAPTPAHVLLTGATGFLGAFTLRALLDRTDATVHCLVRGTDPEHAGKRLRGALENHGLWDERCTRRVTVVHGDLARPSLGLSEDAFDRLARTVDAVHHVGAAVNLVSSYRQLKAATVDGTTEILRLAARHRTVPVHHVSTVGVYAGTAPHPIGPEHPTGPPEALEHGYTQSKWVAEGLVEQARRRGLPVTMYRPTRITGHSRTGACQTGDYLWLMLKGCVQAQAAPARVDTAFDLAPVDYVADALVALSLLPGTAGRTFHLAAGRRLRLETALDWLRTMGHRLPEVSPQAWLDRIGTDPGNAAYPLLGTLAAELTGAGSEGGLAFDPTATDAALAATDVRRPAPGTDRKRFALNVAHFTATGWLPEPGEARVRDSGGGQEHD
ncbi:amino acid adenylation domain-containing protein [Streptomyces sp. TRM S81-3]|uniref:Amino acid adenylation domain-containing protein n=1 Tax=Streptomyces griseicoloratus TaxID=2752516 RepID=A0A926QRB0_9ACTN|nr:non-ribosomal peptide synthetase [Streptomyces griseicoloratus]MBD0420460.1 amino acid adenylation domain-containing protein [Streptomyces griseicoloratus]